jgi:V8-like Glu-specific endopeptidase
MADKGTRSGAASNPAAERQALREAAQALIDRLKKGGGEFDEGLSVAQQLREKREFELLNQVTDQLRRAGDERPTVRRLQAQSFIEQGNAVAALDILEGAAAKLGKKAPEWAEMHGLMGRAWKQIFFDAEDKTTDGARKALANSFAQYAIPYKAAPKKNQWHGLNLLALANFARAENIPVDFALDSERLARAIVSSLRKTPEAKRDRWYHASLAEAQLALNDLGAVEESIGLYARDPKTTDFQLGGTLRQFTDLWLLDKKGEREDGIVQALRAALMRDKQDGHLELTPGQIKHALEDRPTDDQLQAILGDEGPKTYRWFAKGLESAKSVGSIWDSGLKRHGTGFLVKGSDFRQAWGDDLFVLTNSHVVSDDLANGGIPARDASVRFEALDNAPSYPVDIIVWISGRTKLDACLLRLAAPVKDIASLRPYTARLPAPNTDRVFVIGYPGGADLSISFQDNMLLDHEGPPDGKPTDPEVCRLQYRTPTKPGSSGSPVFNSRWQVVALHHAGHEDPVMRRLNGSTERWSANQGIWIKSIVDGVSKA